MLEGYCNVSRDDEYVLILAPKFSIAIFTSFIDCYKSRLFIKGIKKFIILNKILSFFLLFVQIWQISKSNKNTQENNKQDKFLKITYD